MVLATEAAQATAELGAAIDDAMEAGRVVPCIEEPQPWLAPRVATGTEAIEACHHCPAYRQCAQVAAEVRWVGGGRWWSVASAIEPVLATGGI